MRSWSIYFALVVAALVTLGFLANGFPTASRAVVVIGTAVIVVGAGLGAKYVKHSLALRRRRGR